MEPSEGRSRSGRVGRRRAAPACERRRQYAECNDEVVAQHDSPRRRPYAPDRFEGHAAPAPPRY